VLLAALLALAIASSILFGAEDSRLISALKQSSTTSPTASTQAFRDLRKDEFLVMSTAILANPF
jgi:hypothetical protein